MNPNNYWEKRYEENNTPWDLNQLSPPIRNILNSVPDPENRILIPGAGRGFEAGYAFEIGLENTFYSDISDTAAQVFKKLHPDFPKDQVLVGDFFNLEPAYDIIIEQTFFCSMSPDLRPLYVQKCHSLLNENGTIQGVLFASEFERKGPPFGGIAEEYEKLFSTLFSIEMLEPCTTSVLPRLGNELIFSFKKI